MSGEDNAARREFWTKLRKDRETELRENERLCGIAFVKRRLVRHFADFTAAIESDAGSRLDLKGWKLPTNQPSVVYMAAVHWLEELLTRAGEDHRAELKALLEAGQALAGERDEWDSRIQCSHDAAKGYFAKIRYPRGRYCKSAGRNLIALDGSLFFENLRLDPERYGGDQAVKAFGAKLNALLDQLDDDMPRAPTPFYAVLMMDGDNLGKHMSHPDNQEVIPAALDRFTTEAAGIVQRSNGSLIYAGGDDVLAILPLEDALACALQLRNSYLDAFKTQIPKDRSVPLCTTLSGAVIFAHVKTPLAEVLRQAHSVLDKVAKDATGRDAIAVRVLKPGGEHLTWARPWENKNRKLAEGVLQLDGLVDVFRRADESASGFSSKFFFKVRERPELLTGGGFSRDDQVALVKADFLSSESGRRAFPSELRGDDKKTERRDWLDERIGALLDHCTVVKRRFDAETEKVIYAADDGLSADALMLVRFLAHKGVEPGE